jgi:hypothetical protein
MPLGRALTTYRPADNCIPLTSYFRLLLDLRLQPSEIALRLPSLLASIALLIGLPLWIRPRVGSIAALATGVLMAVSPLLIHYCCLIRSYAMIDLLCWLALVAFFYWLETDSRRAGALFALSGAVAVWFHPVAGPIVVSPFVYFLIVKLSRRQWLVPKWRSAILVGLTLAAWVLVFVLPAKDSLVALISLKRSAMSLTWTSWKGVAGIFAGTASLKVTIFFWVLALLGWALWAVRRPRETGLVLVAVLGQVVGLLILSPYAMGQAKIFARYLLVTLPWVLVGVATAVALPAQMIWNNRVGQLVGAALTAVIASVLVTRGPLLDVRLDDPFRFRPEALHYYFEQPPRRQNDLPHYKFVTSTPEPGAVVEYPWHTTWRYSTFITEPWSKHRRQVIVCPGERLLWDDRLGFHNMIAPLPDEVLTSGAALFVLHLDPAKEEALYERRARDQVPPGSALARDLRLQSNDLKRFGEQARARSGVFIQRWGRPDFSSDLALVWNLQRIRGEQSSGLR